MFPAAGHYVRIEESFSNKKHVLLRAIPTKMYQAGGAFRDLVVITVGLELAGVCKGWGGLLGLFGLSWRV
jgi:hypothetical protein